MAGWVLLSVLTKLKMGLGLSDFLVERLGE